ncbi:hypothetical protein HMI54_008147 [Coelomomyces lativittatus]|nr:hypothetical protein HMI56_001321 [Coelomomyces lativittatus]KAJ1510357.1 hypothetical protein HMI55_007022 [Coelomomyces lativittatus]KAJ1516796.1 hypothetical protein HMI54_008147 [Coelomomyces lativittatus]
MKIAETFTIPLKSGSSKYSYSDISPFLKNPVKLKQRIDDCKRALELARKRKEKSRLLWKDDCFVTDIPKLSQVPDLDEKILHRVERVVEVRSKPASNPTYNPIPPLTNIPLERRLEPIVDLHLYDICETKKSATTRAFLDLQSMTDSFKVIHSRKKPVSKMNLCLPQGSFQKFFQANSVLFPE